MPIDDADRRDRLTFVLLLTLVASAGLLYLIRSFLIDVALAAIFAGMLSPFFEKALPVFSYRKGAAATAVLLCALAVVVLPCAMIVTTVVSEAVQLGGSTAVWVQHAIVQPHLIFALLPKNALGPLGMQRIVAAISAHAADVVNVLSGYVSMSLASMLGGLGRFILGVIVTGFGTVYFLTNGGLLVTTLVEHLPMSRETARGLLDKTHRITAATLRSVVIGGAVDGLLIGTGFAFVGITQPWFWGTIAVIASQIPVLGCAVVWIPAAGYLVLAGHFVSGLELALWGTAINTIADTLLRVHIIGRGAALPAYLVLLSTLGGIATLGPVGVLIGPVLAGVVIAMLDLYLTSEKPSDFPAPKITEIKKMIDPTAERAG